MEGTLDLVSMFTLGIVGSGHCVGMCGPLVLALPSAVGRRRAHLFYHLGRITTYTLVGACMGGIGAALGAVGGAASSAPSSLAAIQVAVSTLAALVLVVFGLARLGIVREPQWMDAMTPARLPGYRSVQRNALQQGGERALILFGLLLGLLPCGLSYAAFARALPAGGPLRGAGLLLSFGLGTLPGLLLVGGAASGVARRYGALFNVVSGVLMVGMAASLLVDALTIWIQ